MEAKTGLTQIDAYSKALKTIESLYEGESGKKFIHHLIYSFSTDTYLILFSKKELFDCLSRDRIYPVYSKDRPLNNSEVSMLLDQYKNQSDEEKDENILKKVNQIVSDYVTENKLTRIAIRSTKTNKLMGLEEMQALSDFIVSELNRGNKVIKRMVEYKSNPVNKPHKSESSKKKEESYEEKLKALRMKYTK